MAVSVASFAQVASWFSATSPKTVTGVAWSVNDVIVVVGGRENCVDSSNNPTNANLTFGAPKTSIVTGAGTEAASYIWLAQAATAQTGQTISMTATGATNWGFSVHVLSGASGSFANASSNRTESGFTFTPGAGSAVIYHFADWNANATDQTIATGSGTATERVDNTDSSTYANYVGDWAGTGGSSATFGVSSYSGLQVGHSVIEILPAVAAAGDQYPIVIGLPGLIGPDGQVFLPRPVFDTQVTAPGPQVVGIGVATEIDIANPIARRKTEALGIATETDVANAIGRRKTEQLGIATEVDVANTIARLKTRAIGLATEVDVVNVVSRRKTEQLGVATEVDNSLAIGRVKARVLGLATEVDQALAISRRKAMALGVVSEVDVALPITRLLPSLGIATETDISQPIGRRKTRALGLATETNNSLAIGRRKARSLGLAVEVDNSLAITRVRGRLLGLATEIDLSRPITNVRKAKQLGVATEVDVALHITQLLPGLGIATETDIALPLTRRKLRVLGLATEVDVAQAFTHRKGKLLGLAVEIDIAKPIGTHLGPLDQLHVVGLGTLELPWQLGELDEGGWVVGTLELVWGLGQLQSPWVAEALYHQIITGDLGRED